MSFKSAVSFSNISAVQQHIAKHKKILAIILSVSPAQLQPHIKDCVVNHNKLLIYVSSAAWASQLRFFHAQIKEAVNSQSKEKVELIRIRVLSPSPYKKKNKQKKLIPSPENIELLRNNATTITEGKLKSALLKLSNTLQQSNQ